jgi:hypothetical protein
VLRFFREHRGRPTARSALMAPISARFVTAVKAYAETEGWDSHDFERGHRKDDVAKEHLARFDGEEGERLPHREAANPTTGRPYAWIVPSTPMVNQYCGSRCRAPRRRCTPRSSWRLAYSRPLRQSRPV